MSVIWIFRLVLGE